MHQHSQTWKQSNPYAFFITDMRRNAKKKISFGKFSLEILLTFVFFIGFSFLLNFVDNHFSKDQNTGILFDHVNYQGLQKESLEYYFNQGYIGYNLTEDWEYKLEIEQKIEKIRQFENYI